VSAARLSDPARALIAWLRRRGPATDDALWHEFVTRRGYYPEDLYGARADALAAGAIVAVDDAVELGAP
jgi:hypothetical protein